MVSLAKIDAFCGKVMSTTSSGRSDAGRTVAGTSGDWNGNERRARRHPDGDPPQPHRADQQGRNQRSPILGAAGAAPSAVAAAAPEQRREQDGHEPRHEQRDGHHGEDREGVSPAELCAIHGHEARGRDERAGEHRKCHRFVRRTPRSRCCRPGRQRVVMTSTVVIASSTSRPSAMIRAPSEMRCRSMLERLHDRKVIARVSGIEAATIAPGRMPRLTMLTAMMMAMACQREGGEFADGVVDDGGLVGHQDRLDADRQVVDDVADHGRHVAAEARCRRRCAWRSPADGPACR